MAQIRLMTQCQCQNVAFESVLDHAKDRNEWELETLCAQVGCGQICTACRGDLEEFLNQRCPLRELRQAMAAAKNSPALQESEVTAA